jgi:hypothetical protein
MPSAWRASTYWEGFMSEKLQKIDVLIGRAVEWVVSFSGVYIMVVVMLEGIPKYLVGETPPGAQYVFPFAIGLGFRLIWFPWEHTNIFKNIFFCGVPILLIISAAPTMNVWGILGFTAWGLFQIWIGGAIWKAFTTPLPWKKPNLDNEISV